MNTDKKFCSNCGHQVDVEIKFCPNYGQNPYGLNNQASHVIEKRSNKGNQNDKQKAIIAGIVLLLLAIAVFFAKDNLFVNEQNYFAFSEKEADTETKVNLYSPPGNEMIGANFAGIYLYTSINKAQEKYPKLKYVGKTKYFKAPSGNFFEKYSTPDGLDVYVIDGMIYRIGVTSNNYGLAPGNVHISNTLKEFQANYPWERYAYAGSRGGSVWHFHLTAEKRLYFIFDGSSLDSSIIEMGIMLPMDINMDDLWREKYK